MRLGSPLAARRSPFASGWPRLRPLFWSYCKSLKLAHSPTQLIHFPAGTSAPTVAHVSGKQVTRLVREAITANERQHNKVNFQITDKGVSITPVGVSKCGEISLAADKLRRIVPGTLKTKSGKSFRVALVIEKSPSENGMITYHVFQFKRDGDVR